MIGGLTGDELDARFQRHRVFIAPLFNNTGVATKIVNAMSRGLPVVTTAGGVRGLGLDDSNAASAAGAGGAVCVGETAAEFARCASPSVATTAPRRGPDRLNPLPLPAVPPPPLPSRTAPPCSPMRIAPSLPLSFRPRASRALAAGRRRFVTRVRAPLAAFISRPFRAAGVS